jgi:hypothetical protein
MERRGGTGRMDGGGREGGRTEAKLPEAKARLAHSCVCACAVSS